MVKYFKQKFMNRIIEYYDNQIFSLSMETGYNKHLSQEQVDKMLEEINEFNKIKEALGCISLDLLSGKF